MSSALPSDLAPDPATLVLDSIEGFIASKGGNLGEVHAIRMTCVSILECLYVLTPEIEPNARERAREVAMKCKMLITDGKWDNWILVLGFLHLVVTYGLSESFEADGILDILVLVRGRRLLLIYAGILHLKGRCLNDVPEVEEFEGNQHSGFKVSSKKGWEAGLKEELQSANLPLDSIKTKAGKILVQKKNLKGYVHLKERLAKKNHVELDGEAQKSCGKFTKSRFQKLIEELDFDERWFPLIDYLSTFGLKESHFVSIYERHMPSLQISLVSAKERLTFLIAVGVKRRDIKRILVRQPQILEYTVENNMMSHVRFLLSIGIPSSRIGQIATAAPSLFSYSVEHSLKPKIRYLIEEVGIKAADVSKVVQLSPQVLVQRVENSFNSRLSFLSEELGASRESIVKMVKKHPQLLHYSIKDGMLPRITFLRSIGMRDSDIVKVLTSLTQVLSLSLEKNLKPKYLYLVNELQNEVQSLLKYPMYLSLSLDQRIRPRHRFLVSLKKAPKGPFPLSTFVPTDECFCQQWAGTSLDKYLAFRQSLLLTDFAKKYEKKR